MKKGISVKKVIVHKDTYYDSVFLMQVTAQLKGRAGIDEVQVTMATPQNKTLLHGLGFTEGIDDAGANDLLIAISGDEKVFDGLQADIKEMLVATKSGAEGESFKPSSINGALKVLPEANMAIISVAGEYAANEARKALNAGLHVMLFSDNVSLEDEVELKTLAGEKGLLVMGPDCGTAIINGSPLCFANEVRQGAVGVVAASGTGAQEVSVLIDRFGGGCSQVIGTGGRDLKEGVGGKTMLQGIEALKKDEATKVILVVSKPPAKEVAGKVIDALEKCGKPAVVHFIGSKAKADEGQVYMASSLEGAALASLAAIAGEPATEKTFTLSDDEVAALINQEVSGKKDEQKYVRGYFTGGTLCDEALFVLKEDLENVRCNIHPDKSLCLADPFKSEGHTLVDLGDDTFTQGRPHPMIEPATRVERMEAEADDSEIAVVLLDVVLGHGSHEDPAGAIVPVIKKAKENAKNKGGNLTVLASIVGTERDFQGFASQRAKLEEVGVVIMPSNAQMAKLAAKIMKEMGV